MNDAAQTTGERPTVNIRGRFVALGPLRRDLVPTYARWDNDYGTRRTDDPADARPTNPAGLRAYTKAGFREIGRWRESALIGGRYFDTVFMECLAQEFENPVLAQVFAPDGG